MRFLIGPHTIEVHGDSSFLKAFQVETASIRQPLDSSGEADIRLRWQEHSASLDARWLPCPREIRVRDLMMRLSLSWTLLGQAISARPGWTAFHGTALRHRQSGQLLWLLGVSGSGKTTLTCHKLAGFPEWQILAEDLVVLDCEAREVMPFPRAATLRGEELGVLVTTAGTIGRLVPVKENGHGVARVLLQYEDTDSAAALTLKGSKVVLLTPAREVQDVPSGAQDRLLLSWCDDALLEALRAGDFAPGETTACPGGVALVLEQPVTAARWPALVELLEAHRSLLLRRSTGAGDWRFHRDPSPSLRSIGVAEGAVSLLRHQVLSPDSVRRTKPAVAMMHLARLFHDCRFWELTPGGGPEETLELLASISR